MCGISGCLVTNGSAMAAVVRALNKLQNRGYDSAGISTVGRSSPDVRITDPSVMRTIADDKLLIHKSVSESGENAVLNINNHALATSDCNIATAHTRWATHGPKTLANAHPHTDSNQEIAIVHNGIIENHAELRAELIQQGYSFYGQTDTEVVAKYIGYLRSQGQSILNVQQYLTGSWAILILDRSDSNTIYYMVNGSPLILGFNADLTKSMFVSEFIGFDADITDYVVIADGDYGSIRIGATVSHNYSPTKTYTLTPFLNVEIETSPSPYPHWTLKEIHDQPTAITRLLTERLGSCDRSELVFPELDSISDRIQEIDHWVLLACGTSYHAAQIGARFFKELGVNTTIEVIDGADFELMDLPPNRTSALILLSQSGETKDLYRALTLAKTRADILSIGLINVENSLIAREVDRVLYLRAGREHAVASTKSFTNQIVMLLMLALRFSPSSSKLKSGGLSPDVRCPKDCKDFERRSDYLHALSTLSADYYRIIQQSHIEVPAVIPIFTNQTDCFILGKHASEWVAREGALKIKEISYVHSEGFSAAALKHGTFALLTNGTPVIILINNDSHAPKLMNAVSEVKSRHTSSICITNTITASPDIDALFYFETDSVLFPLLQIVPLQFLAYHLAIDRGNHPDYPRNLAKVVTVE